MSSVPNAYRDIMNDRAADAVEAARDCLDNKRRRIGRVAGAMSAAGLAGDGGAADGRFEAPVGHVDGRVPAGRQGPSVLEH